MTSHLMLRPALLTLAIALGGCSLAPTYERPAAPVATDWQVANANGTKDILWVPGNYGDIKKAD